eukprot:gene5733-7917_t
MLSSTSYFSTQSANSNNSPTVSKVTSWRTNEDGELVESDIKYYINQNDNTTYFIESKNESVGFSLGIDSTSQKYTTIKKISDDKVIEKMKPFISIGDILISINERVVLNESFNDVVIMLNMLIQGGYPRKLKFLSVKKCPIEIYLLKLQMEGKSQQDFLGFNCSFEYLVNEIAFRNSTLHVINQRDLEWVDYLKSIGGPEGLKPAGVFKPSKDLKEMVRRGIPVAFRALVWQKISLSSINRLNYPQDYYQSLLARTSELNPSVRDDIEKDVDRTFPEHAYFEPSGLGETSLRRVLQAFALHNPDVGYCQSLNFVAGMMLIFMDEEDTFWLFLTVIEKLLPHDYYTKSMIGTYVDQFVLAHIIKKHLPIIHSTFEKNQLQLPLITVQWFMCIFVNTLRPEVTLRVWDMFLNEGSKVIFRISAALFKLHEPQLLAVRDAADLFTTLRNIGKDVIDADKLISIAYKKYSVKATKIGKNKTKVTHSLMSPRVRSGSKTGLIPADLIGLGLAHFGPVMKQTVIPAVLTTSQEDGHDGELNNNHYKENSISNANGGSTERFNDKYIENATNLASPTVVSMESKSDSKNNSPTMPNIKLHLNTSISLDNEISPPPPNNSPIPDNRKVSSSNNTHENSSNITTDVLPSSPSSAYNYSRNSFSNRLSEDLQKKRMKRVVNQKKGNKNGDLNFYRADISLWRASFRPALEERHIRMENARKAWREQENEQKIFAEDLSLSIHGDESSSSGVKLVFSNDKISLTDSPTPISQQLSGNSKRKSRIERSDSISSVSSIKYIMENSIPVEYNIDRPIGIEEIEETH